MMMVSIHKEQCMRTLPNPPIIFLYVWLKINVDLAGQVCTKINPIFGQNAPQTFLFGMVQMQNFVFFGSTCLHIVYQDLAKHSYHFFVCVVEEKCRFNWVGRHALQALQQWYFCAKFGTELLFWSRWYAELFLGWVHESKHSPSEAVLTLPQVFWSCS